MSGHTTHTQYGRARKFKPKRRMRRPVPRKLRTKVAVKRLRRRVSYLAKRLAPERYIHDESPSFTNITSVAPAAVCLTDIAANNAVGTGADQRNGITYRISYCVARFSLFRVAVSDQLSDFVRVVLVQDKRQVQDNFTTSVTWAGANGVFQNESWQAHLNWQNRGRFTVLYDKLIELDENNPSQTFKCVYRPPNKVVRFNGSLATDVEANHIYVLVIGSDAAGQTDAPTLFVNHRVVYTDN